MPRDRTAKGELLQALGIFQRATPDQLWKLTRPDSRHDKLRRDNLLGLEDNLVRVESVPDDQRQVWVLTARGHREAKKLLEPKGIRVSVLRKEEYDPVTGELLAGGYDDHAAAVTSTAAELHRAGIGHPLAFQTEVGHRLAGGFVQRADLVMRAPASKVPVLLEIDRRSEEAPTGGGAAGVQTVRAEVHRPALGGDHHAQRGPKAGDLSVCGPCRADDIARQKAPEVAREQAAMQSAPEDDRGQEPGRPRRGLFRRRS
ncbi:hypothetical protein [Streptomyces sp. SYSU K21746]